MKKSLCQLRGRKNNAIKRRTFGSFEEGSKINNRAIKKEPKKALRNNIVKESNPLIL